MNGMTWEREARILEAAIETFGENAQIDMAIEEMAELTKALLKHRRGLADFEGVEALARRVDSVLEELADVEIMLSQMALIFGDPSEYEIDKLERLAKRIGMED